MSEPYLPLPPPEPDSNRDVTPPRCPECRTILVTNPLTALRTWCPEHGTVKPVFPGDER